MKTRATAIKAAIKLSKVAGQAWVTYHYYAEKYSVSVYPSNSSDAAPVYQYLDGKLSETFCD